MTFITGLSLSNNRLTHLKYQGTDEMTLVDDESMAPLLDVVGLPIQAQGLTLSTLKLLVTLDISRNMLTVLPVDFLLLTLLEKLNVKENQVFSLLLSLLDLLVRTYKC